MKKLHMVFGFGIVMAMTGAALACGGHGKGAFGKADSNQDGKVSLAEALTAAKQRFDKWDANKNGVLEGDELRGPMKRFLERADTNKDGKISAAEHEAVAKQRFTERDANKNGVLEGDELKMRHGKGWGKKRGHEKA